ncbi:hypothetical protein [Tardiphaga robiniae]|uniref:hypothetical protein n=1 Tax=Tardiphaga robiniae TaxID=943830 RepID=UPI001112AD83|nr:hypothetical protein [Tardiphaga robiniae]
MIDPSPPAGTSYPSFVQCEPAAKPFELPVVITHWNPIRSGSDAIDADLGQRNFEAAIHFAQRTIGPFFLMRILSDIRKSDRLGAMELAFVAALARRATAGGRPRLSGIDEIETAAIEFDADAGIIREIELATHKHLELGNRGAAPSMINDLLFDWMHGRECWATSVIAYVICSAGLKGSFH